MAGTIDSTISEEDYTKQVWERAMFEGEQKFRIMKGEQIDEDDELATFQSQQDRKQQIMLQRAKEDMKEILRSPGSGGNKDDDE